jgi:hypothetical protein
MRIRRFLLLIVLNLLLATNIQAMTDEEDGWAKFGLTSPQNDTNLHWVDRDIEMGNSTPTVKTAFETKTKKTSYPEEAKKEAPYPTCGNCYNYMPWGENIGGNILSIGGIPVAALGGILVYAYPDLSLLMGKVGFGLVALGMTMDKAGSLLLERSKKEAAVILSKMRTHAENITNENLSHKEIKKLSTEFFGMSERYQSYLGRTSKAVDIVSKMMWLTGPPIAASGLILLFTGNTNLGPVLAVAGATTFTVGESFKKKADAYEEQLKLSEIVTRAHQSIEKKNPKKKKPKMKTTTDT